MYYIVTRKNFLFKFNFKKHVLMTSKNKDSSKAVYIQWYSLPTNQFYCFKWMNRKFFCANKKKKKECVRVILHEMIKAMVFSFFSCVCVCTGIFINLLNLFSKVRHVFYCLYWFLNFDFVILVVLPFRLKFSLKFYNAPIYNDPYSTELVRKSIWTVLMFVHYLKNPVIPQSQNHPCLNKKVLFVCLFLNQRYNHIH